MAAFAYIFGVLAITEVGLCVRRVRSAFVTTYEAWKGIHEG